MKLTERRRPNDDAAPHGPVRRALVGVLTLAAGALTLPGAGQPPVRVAWQDPATIAAAAEAAAVAAGAASVAATAVDSRIKLRQCAGPLDARVERPIERGRGTVTVSCSGPDAWRLFVPVRAMDDAAVVVLKRALQPGEVLRADDLGVEMRPATALPHGYLGDVAEAVGLAVRRAQTAGTVIVVGALEHPEIIERGSLVTLISESGPITVKSEGVALEPGRLRQRVRVRSASGRVVEGTAEGPGQVRVGS